MEANDIAKRATTLMHHFKGQAEELQKQCADLSATGGAGSPGMSIPSHSGAPPAHDVPTVATPPQGRGIRDGIHSA